MRFDRMTIKLQEAFTDAQALCEEERQQSIEPEHLLLTLLRDTDGIAQALSKKVGVDVNRLISEFDAHIKKLPHISGASQVYISVQLKEVMDRAFEEARLIKDDFVSSAL